MVDAFCMIHRHKKKMSRIGSLASCNDNSLMELVDSCCLCAWKAESRLPEGGESRRCHLLVTARDNRRVTDAF